jgi:hypothetical protein
VFSRRAVGRHQRPPKGAIAVRQSHLEKRALDGHARLL